MMRAHRNIMLVVVACALLTACAGSTTGKEMGMGFDALDTTSKEQKENEDWFKSFYGEERCVWGSGCAK